MCPHVATGLVPSHAWAQTRGVHWVEGDTVVQGIGQGYTMLTPISMATAVARIATGRVVHPHITKTIGDEPQTGFDPSGAAVLDVDEEHLKVVRQGMFEVVNTQAGTAYTARLDLPGVQMAGKTGTAQVHNDNAAESDEEL